MATEAQCDACGETNAPGSSFCLFCGAYLGWDQPGAGPSAAPSSAQPSPAPAPAPAPAPVPPKPDPPAPSAPTASLPPVAPSPPGPTRSPQSSGAPPANACPACGHANDAGRRFCARCGYTLVQAAAPTTAGPVRQQGSSGWWPWGNPEERAARRAYRRSLPPLYRWRRVLIALLVLGLAVGLVAFLQGNPVEWGKQRYYDIIDKKVPVSEVSLFVEPGDQQTSDLTDDDPSTFWGMPWASGTPATDSCTATEQRLRIEWPDAVRVRGLEVAPGRRAQDKARDLSPRPKTLLVWWEGAGGRLVCQSVPVPDDPAALDVDLDTEVEVDRMWVSIGDVYPAKNATEERPVVLRALELLRRP